MDLHIENNPIARVIYTDRLVLRPLEESDLPWVCQTAGDYVVSKMLVPVPYPYTMSDAQDFLEMDRSGALGTLWVITRNDNPIGVISIGKELGYWSDPKAWGNGYMTEAGKAAVSAHFACTDNELIKSSHFVGNHGSKRVLEKLGFVDVGLHVHFSNARQSDVAGHSMELTRSRFQTLRSQTQ